MNALKHGLRAATVLLPGEDAEEFHALRQELFDLHRPRTRNEVRCVEAMAEHEWSMARCRRIRDRYQGKLLGLVEETGEAHCEKDPHRWHHSAMDCSLDERRIAKLIDWQVARLEVLQKLRRQRLMERAEQEDLPVPQEASGETGTVPAESRQHSATGSRDEENLESRKRSAGRQRAADAAPLPDPVPAHPATGDASAPRGGAPLAPARAGAVRSPLPAFCP